MTYKDDLERSKSILDIQQSFDILTRILYGLMLIT
jgi:hypothetical protein